MLVTLRRRQPGSRRAELIALRRRVARARREAAGPEERAIAGELRELARELSRRVGEVSACGGCTRGLGGVEGRYQGGHCCSGDTAELFSDDEVALLVQGGTRARDLRPPAGDHAGCAFRGPTGCSLAPVDRPTVCARYLCRELRAELHRRGDLAAIQALVDRLDDGFRRFAALRGARIDDELLGAPAAV